MDFLYDYYKPFQGFDNLSLNEGRTIDVSSLPPGIYIAVARDDHCIIGTAKFVVLR